MIYILGMSHIYPVLGACSAEDGQKIRTEDEPAFVDWRTKPGVLAAPVRAASIYIRDYAPHWGEVLAEQTEPTVISIAPGFRALLDSIDPENGKSVLFVFMQGEEYYQLAVGNFERPEDCQPADFYMPWHPELSISPLQQVVPLEVMERLMEFFLTKAAATFTAIRSLWPGLRVVNVICPPPPDLDCYAKVIHDKSRLASASLNYSARLKYYLLYRKILRETAALRGIETLLPPAATVRPDGLLRSEYAGDGLHGNLLYGSLVCEQMNELLQAGVR